MKRKPRKCDYCDDYALITIEVKKYRRVGRVCLNVKCQDRFHREVADAKVS